MFHKNIKKELIIGFLESIDEIDISNFRSDWYSVSSGEFSGKHYINILYNMKGFISYCIEDNRIKLPKCDKDRYAKKILIDEEQLNRLRPIIFITSNNEREELENN